MHAEKTSKGINTKLCVHRASALKKLSQSPWLCHPASILNFHAHGWLHHLVAAPPQSGVWTFFGELGNLDGVDPWASGNDLPPAILKGWKSLSPGLRACELPWVYEVYFIYPERVKSAVLNPRRTVHRIRFHNGEAIGEIHPERKSRGDVSPGLRCRSAQPQFANNQSKKFPNHFATRNFGDLRSWSLSKLRSLA
jgi:hypothetical protein